MEYSKEALDPRNLAEVIDEQGNRIRELEQLVIEIDSKYQSIVRIHLKLIEENTEQIGMIIKILEPGKLSKWLARFGL
jgi:hypothetical protein